MSEQNYEVLFSAKIQPNHALHRLWYVNELLAILHNDKIEIQAILEKCFNVDPISVCIPICNETRFHSKHFIQTMGSQISRKLQEKIFSLPLSDFHQLLIKYNNLAQLLALAEFRISGYAIQWVRIHCNDTFLGELTCFQVPDISCDASSGETIIQYLQQLVSKTYNAEFVKSPDQMLLKSQHCGFAPVGPKNYIVLENGEWKQTNADHQKIKALLANLKYFIQAPPETEETKVGYMVYQLLNSGYDSIWRIVGRNEYCVLWQIVKYTIQKDPLDHIDNPSYRALQMSYAVQYLSERGEMYLTSYDSFDNPPIEKPQIEPFVPTHISQVSLVLEDGELTTTHPDEYVCKPSEYLPVKIDQESEVHLVFVEHKVIPDERQERWVLFAHGTFFELTPTDWRVQRWKQHQKLIKKLTDND